MTKLPSSIQKLINELSKLPGIGPKSAQRLAFYLLKKDKIDIDNLSSSVANIKQGVVFCSTCHMMADVDPCTVCSDSKRDHSLVCVVEETLDAQALDKSGQYNGIFHVLGGVLNPLEGIGPEQLEIDSLVARVKDSTHIVKEVVVATNPSLEGETTAMHLTKLLKTANPALKITRIARGIPMGGDLEYADDITLMRSMQNRTEL